MSFFALYIFVLLSAIHGSIVVQATGTDCNLPGYVFWASAYSPQGTLSSWSITWSAAGRQSLMQKCNVMDACVAFSDPGDLKGFLRPVGEWGWSPKDDGTNCLGTYIKEAVSAKIPKEAASLAQAAAMAAASVQGPVPIIATGTPSDDSNFTQEGTFPFYPIGDNPAGDMGGNLWDTGGVPSGKGDGVVNSNGGGGVVNSSGGAGGVNSIGGSTGDNSSINSGYDGSGIGSTGTTGTTGPSPLIGNTSDLAASTGACNYSSNLIPGFRFYPNRFIEDAPMALEITSIILDEMMVVQPLLVAASCFRLSWCYAFDTTGRIWGDLTKLSQYADMLGQQPSTWRPKDARRRGVCGGTFLRLAPDLAGCTARTDYMLYPGSYASNNAYQTLPGGFTLDDLLDACSNVSVTQCAAAQYPEMVLLSSPPAAAMIYDVPPAPTGSCMGTYMRLPSFFMEKLGLYETVMVTQQFNSSAPSLLNFSNGGAQLNFSSAAHLIQPRAESGYGSEPTFGAAGSCLCSAFVKVTLTLSSTVILPPDANSTAGDAYGILVFTVQRADGSSLSYDWSMRAPMTNGVVTSQMTMYAVPLHSPHDVVTVNATNHPRYNSLNARLVANITVRSLTPMPLAPPPPAPTPPAPSSSIITAASPNGAASGALPGSVTSAGGTTGEQSDSPVTIGLLVGAIVGAIIAVLSMAAAFFTLFALRRPGRRLKYAKPRGTLPASAPLPTGSRPTAAGSTSADDTDGAVPPFSGASAAAVTTPAVPVDAASTFTAGTASLTCAMSVRDIPYALKNGPSRTSSGAIGLRDPTDPYPPPGAGGGPNTVMPAEGGEVPAGEAGSGVIGCWGCGSWWPARLVEPSLGAEATWEHPHGCDGVVNDTRVGTADPDTITGPQTLTCGLPRTSLGGENTVGDKVCGESSAAAISVSTSSVSGTHESGLAGGSGNGLPAFRFVCAHPRRSLRGPGCGSSIQDNDDMELSSVPEGTSRSMDALMDAGVGSAAPGGDDAHRDTPIMNALAVGVQRRCEVLPRTVELESSFDTWACGTLGYEGTAPAPSTTVDLASASVMFELAPGSEASGRASWTNRRQDVGRCSVGRSIAVLKPQPTSGASTLDAGAARFSSTGWGPATAPCSQACNATRSDVLEASAERQSRARELVWGGAEGEPVGSRGSATEGASDGASANGVRRSVLGGQGPQLCKEPSRDGQDYMMKGGLLATTAEPEAATLDVQVEANNVDIVSPVAHGVTAGAGAAAASAASVTVLVAAEESGKDGQVRDHFSQPLPQPCRKPNQLDRVSSLPAEEPDGPIHMDCMLRNLCGLVRGAEHGPASGSEGLVPPRSLGTTAGASSSFHTVTGGWSLASGPEDGAILHSFGRVPSLLHLPEEQPLQEQSDEDHVEECTGPPNSRDGPTLEAEEGWVQERSQWQDRDWLCKGIEAGCQQQQQQQQSETAQTLKAEVYQQEKREDQGLGQEGQKAIPGLGQPQGGERRAQSQQGQPERRLVPALQRVQDIMGAFLTSWPAPGKRFKASESAKCQTAPPAVAPPSVGTASTAAASSAASTTAGGSAAGMQGHEYKVSSGAVFSRHQKMLQVQMQLQQAQQDQFSGRVELTLTPLEGQRLLPSCSTQGYLLTKGSEDTLSFAEPWQSQLSPENSGGFYATASRVMLPIRAAVDAVAALHVPPMSLLVSPSRQSPQPQPPQQQLHLPLLPTGPLLREALPPIYSDEESVPLYQTQPNSETAQEASLSTDAVPDPNPAQLSGVNASVTLASASVGLLEGGGATGTRTAIGFARRPLAACLVPAGTGAAGTSGPLSTSTCTSASVYSGSISTSMGGPACSGGGGGLGVASAACTLSPLRSRRALTAGTASGTGGASVYGNGGAYGSGGASGSGGSSCARGISTDDQLWSNPLLKVVVGESPLLEDVDLYISPDDLQLTALIGKGASGEVYHAWWRGQQVAVKKLLEGYPPHQQPQEMRTLLQEMAILTRARHPNIVRCYGGCLQPPQVFLVEELLVCSLHDFIYHPHGDHSPLKLLGLARDVALGLAYLHPTILHRDLKPSNILIDMNGRAKIADFGLARYKLRTHLSTHNLEAGTTPYLPPEVFDQRVKHLTDRSDVYSLGMIMWELFARQPPWHNMRDVAIAYNVHVNRARPPMPSREKCPPRLARLIQACWAHRPRDRPSAAEVVKELTLTITQLEMQ